MKKNRHTKCSLIFLNVILALLPIACFSQPIEKVDPVESLLPMLLGLLGILVLIFILAMLVKKVAGFNLVANHIHVIESQSLGAKEKLVIVEIQSQQYVLGVTSHSINPICQLDKKIEKKQPPIGFEQLLKQFAQPVKSDIKKSLTETSVAACETK